MKQVKYDIQRWDSVIEKGNTFPYPMVYVKKNGLKNGSLVKATISDSNSMYDGQTVGAIVKCSAGPPLNTPNFYKETDLFVILLFAPWLGYPAKLGTVLVESNDSESIRDNGEGNKGNKGNIEDENMGNININVDDDDYSGYNKSTRCKLTAKQIVVIFLTLFILMLLSIWLLTNK